MRPWGYSICCKNFEYILRQPVEYQDDYNQHRPHDSPGLATPMACCQQLMQVACPVSQVLNPNNLLATGILFA